MAAITGRRYAATRSGSNTMKRPQHWSGIWPLVGALAVGCGAPSDLVGTDGSAGAANSAGAGGRGGAAGAPGHGGTGGSGPALPSCGATVVPPECLTITRRASEVTTCRAALGVSIVSPAVAKVLVDCVPITDGSYTVDVPTETVTLTGQTCAALLNGTAQRIDVVIDCPPR
jgi:hypothetical protein